jgi:hypothetical protein
MISIFNYSIGTHVLMIEKMMMLQEIRFDKRSQPVVPQNVHLLQAVH